MFTQSFVYHHELFKGGNGMKKKNTVQLVAQMVLPIVQKNGLQLWDVVFEKEGTAWFLRILLDCETRPVTVQDCEHVSSALSPLLDQEDPIEQSYYLEVSSAGLGRKLTKEDHFLASIGKEVTVRLIRPVEKKREFVGVLTKWKDGRLFIDEDNCEKSFALSDCAFIKWNDDLDLFSEA